jgi:hypothetical protein
MKFLSASFREAMSDFFGKAGMPWHGVMLIRRAKEGEGLSEGVFVVSYIDGMMTDKKEDGFATLSAVYLALKSYKKDHPWIKRCAVKTDGAGAYAGLVFTVGLSMMGELTGIRVTDHYIGESGKGKSQLDGHFGVKGSQLRRIVAAALHDILSPAKLFEGVKRTLGRNESAQLFQPDRSRGSTLDTESVKHLSAMSHREYEYESDGTFVALVLRQQTDLGDGLSIAAATLRKPGAPAFAPPRLLSAAGVTHVPDSTGAVGGTANSAVTKPEPQPMARTKAAREAAESSAAQRRFGREKKAKQQASW